MASPTGSPLKKVTKFFSRISQVCISPARAVGGDIVAGPHGMDATPTPIPDIEMAEVGSGSGCGSTGQPNYRLDLNDSELIKRMNEIPAIWRRWAPKRGEVGGLEEGEDMFQPCRGHLNLQFTYKSALLVLTKGFGWEGGSEKYQEIATKVKFFPSARQVRKTTWSEFAGWNEMYAQAQSLYNGKSTLADFAAQLDKFHETQPPMESNERFTADAHCSIYALVRTCE
jgi:hypothetical protein